MFPLPKFDILLLIEKISQNDFNIIDNLIYDATQKYTKDSLLVLNRGKLIKIPYVSFFKLTHEEGLSVTIENKVKKYCTTCIVTCAIIIASHHNNIEYLGWIKNNYDIMSGANYQNVNELCDLDLIVPQHYDIMSGANYQNVNELCDLDLIVPQNSGVKRYKSSFKVAVENENTELILWWINYDNTIIINYKDEIIEFICKQSNKVLVELFQDRLLTNNYNIEILIKMACTYSSNDFLEWIIKDFVKCDKDIRRGLKSAIGNISRHKHLSHRQRNYYENVKILENLFSRDVTEDFLQRCNQSGLDLLILEGYSNIPVPIHETKIVLDMSKYKCYDDRIIIFACKRGLVCVLDWIVKTNEEFKYDSDAIYYASINSNINVLNWWINSGFDLKYDCRAIDQASALGKVDVLDWWFNSKLELKYSKNAMIHASEKAQFNSLNWWLHKKNDLPLLYDKIVLDIAVFTEHLDVIEWWKNSGLILDEYTNINPGNAYRHLVTCAR